MVSGHSSVVRFPDFKGCRHIKKLSFRDTRGRKETNKRCFFSREERIRYATTVGLIPQEGRRQNHGAELFCREPEEEERERKRERERGMHVSPWNAEGPRPRMRQWGEKGKGQEERGQEGGGWKSNGITERSVVRGRR